MSSPSALLKVNYLVMRYLHFGSMRGDLQEGHVCSSRCQLPLFGTYLRLPEHKIGVFVRFYPPKPSFSGFSSTKSGFLCVFTLRNPHFRPFRAQNRGFCALLPASFSRLWFLWAPCQQHLPDGYPPQRRLSQGASPQRPGQQQTSSGGEKYSGLASNLAHLGRIC